MGLKKAAVARLCLNGDIYRAMPEVCDQYLPPPAPGYPAPPPVPTRRPHAGDVRQRRQRMVLVVSPTRLSARRSSDWSLPYGLCSISARDECAGADQLLTLLHDRLVNRTQLSMCRTWDMAEPANDAIG